MMQYVSEILDFSNDKKEECLVCFEEKKLKSFCGSHKFCDSCCKKWTTKNLCCPVCRKICTNSNYLVYNFELVNIEYEEVTPITFSRFFKNWHNQTCIKKHHKFKILKCDNSIILHCLQCNVEEVFRKELMLS
jgi:hypothetical protein